MFDIEGILKTKNEQRDQWREILNFSRQTLPVQVLNDDNLSLIANACNTPKQFETFSKKLYLHSKSHPNPAEAFSELKQNVDNSKFSLSEWMQAIEYFYSWLEQNNRKTSFLKMLGYLQCCGDSPENKDIRRNFVELLKEMLDTYGFDG